MLRFLVTVLNIIFDYQEEPVSQCAPNDDENPDWMSIIGCVLMIPAIARANLSNALNLFAISVKIK